jgi:hypothetical protein
MFSSSIVNKRVIPNGKAIERTTEIIMHKAKLLQHLIHELLKKVKQVYLKLKMKLFSFNN